MSFFFLAFPALLPRVVLHNSGNICTFVLVTQVKCVPVFSEKSVSLAALPALPRVVLKNKKVIY